MGIRTRNPNEPRDAEYLRLRRKADQAWELGGLARQDGDTEAMNRHYDQAREWGRLASERKREIHG